MLSTVVALKRICLTIPLIMFCWCLTCAVSGACAVVAVPKGKKCGCWQKERARVPFPMAVVYLSL